MRCYAEDSTKLKNEGTIYKESGELKSSTVLDLRFTGTIATKFKNV
jgi:hypothetical protein